MMARFASMLPQTSPILYVKSPWSRIGLKVKLTSQARRRQLISVTLRLIVSMFFSTHTGRQCTVTHMLPRRKMAMTATFTRMFMLRPVKIQNGIAKTTTSVKIVIAAVEV